MEVLVGVLGLILAWFVWRNPRSATKPNPSFSGTLDTDRGRKLIDFLSKNGGRIVNIAVAFGDEVWNADANIVATMARDDDRPGHYMLTIYNTHRGDLSGGGTLVSIFPDQKSGWSSVAFASGRYHLQGFYYVDWRPGMSQGFVYLSLLTVLPSDVALKS